MAIIENLNPGILFLIIAILGVSIIILLKKIEGKISTKITEERKEKKEENYFKIQIAKLKRMNTNPENELKSIDNLARNFLIKTFGTGKNTSYYEMSEFFKKKGKYNIENLCQKMVEIYYSGEKIEKNKLKETISILELIIDQESMHELKIEQKETTLKEKVLEKLKQFNKIEHKSEQKIKKLIDLPVLEIEEKEQINEDVDLGTGIPNKENKEDIKEKIIQPVIKTEIKEYQKIINPVFKKEKIEVEKVKIEKREPKEYRHIESVDILDRIKERMKNNSFVKI